MVQVLTVSLGVVGPLPWNGHTASSAIANVPVRGPVEIGTLGLAGDEQADRTHHGRPDKAVLL